MDVRGGRGALFWPQPDTKLCRQLRGAAVRLAVRLAVRRDGSFVAVVPWSADVNV